MEFERRLRRRNPVLWGRPRRGPPRPPPIQDRRGSARGDPQRPPRDRRLSGRQRGLNTLTGDEVERCDGGASAGSAGATRSSGGGLGGGRRGPLRFIDAYLGGSAA